MARILDERDRKELQNNLDISVEEINKNIENLEEDVSNDINSLNTELSQEIDSLESRTNSKINSLANDVYTDINSVNSYIESVESNLDERKVDKDGDKVLSENDLTDTLKTNYDSAYEHSQDEHAPVEAEENVQADWSIEDSSLDSYIKNKPTSMKNPNSLILTGAVNATYDGSAITTVEIPICKGIETLFMRVSDGYLQYSSDNVEWINLMLTSDMFVSGGVGGLHISEDGTLYFG